MFDYQRGPTCVSVQGFSGESILHIHGEFVKLMKDMAICVSTKETDAL